MKNYYHTLGISEEASLEEIKNAYRKLSKKFHPDKNEDDNFFKDRFIELKDAYDVLSNEIKREEYDEQLRAYELSNRSALQRETDADDRHSTKAVRRAKKAKTETVINDTGQDEFKTVLFNIGITIVGLFLLLSIGYALMDVFTPKKEIQSIQSTEKTSNVENQNSSIKAEVPTHVEEKNLYTIINFEKTGKNKCEVDVRIQSKLTNLELQSSANKIKQGLDSKWEVVYIFFFLPKMEIGNGAWARVTFDPNMTLEVIGQTIEQENNINKYLTTNHQKFIGQWVDNFLPMEIIHRMKTENGKIILEAYCPSENDASKLTELERIKKGSQIIYRAVDNDDGEYYIINKNGDLEVYDSEGYIATYSSLK